MEGRERERVETVEGERREEAGRRGKRPKERHEGVDESVGREKQDTWEGVS